MREEGILLEVEIVLAEGVMNWFAVRCHSMPWLMKATWANVKLLVMH